jgi:hypothetical protein
MRFALEQELPGTVDAVIAALLDPEFLRRLGDLPTLDVPRVLDQTRTGDRVVQRVHYTFTGSLSPAVTRVIDPKKVTWIDETTYDLTAKQASFRIIPDHYVNKLRCAGSYTFTGRGDATVRRVDGELSVRVPLVGRVVERAIMSGLEDHLGTEGRLLATWLEDNG